MEKLTRIASFTVDHDYISEGIYVSRIDGDITTYDMRTRRPNAGEYMDNLTMHSFEHLFATMIRSSEIGADVIYFGPMGCQTGFYLLVRDADNSRVFSAVTSVLQKIAEYDGEMPGATRKECGNYRNLDVASASREAERYLKLLGDREPSFKYEVML